jgi:hypothetical protein
MSYEERKHLMEQQTLQAERDDAYRRKMLGLEVP